LEAQYSDWYWRVCAYDLLGTQGDFSSNNILHIDTINPNFINQTPGLTYTEGSTSNYLTWHPNDLNPNSYTIKKDLVEIESEPWDGSAIILNVDGLTAGEYLFECIIEDRAGNSRSQNVIVTVESGGGGPSSSSDPTLIITFSVIGVAAISIFYFVFRKFRHKPE
jgi:hypothetical protein